MYLLAGVFEWRAVTEYFSCQVKLIGKVSKIMMSIFSLCSEMRPRICATSAPWQVWFLRTLRSRPHFPDPSGAALPGQESSEAGERTQVRSNERGGLQRLAASTLRKLGPPGDATIAIFFQQTNSPSQEDAVDSVKFKIVNYKCWFKEVPS